MHHATVQSGLHPVREPAQPVCQARAQTPAEEFLFGVASGEWKGVLSFRIRSLAAFWKAPASSGDKAVALLLHVMCRLPGRIGVAVRMTGQPARGVVNNHTLLQYEGPMFLPALPLARLEGLLRLGQHGRALQVQFRHFGGAPGWPLGELRAGEGEAASDGQSAVYSVPVFGPGWHGEYRAVHTVHKADTIEARYTNDQSDWAELSYRAARLGPRPERRPPTREQVRMYALGCQLAGRAKDLFQRQHHLALFTDVYAQETFDIADALAGSFQDPSWVCEVALRFGERYLSALDGYLSGGYVPRGWLPVFQALSTRACGELDALLACIHAHILWDLPPVLAEVGEVSSHIRDFLGVEDVVATGLGKVVAEFALRYHPLYLALNRLAGGADRRFVLPWVAYLRQVALLRGLRHAAGEADRRAAEQESLCEIEDLISALFYPASAPRAFVIKLLRSLMSGDAYWRRPGRAASVPNEPPSSAQEA